MKKEMILTASPVATTRVKELFVLLVQYVTQAVQWLADRYSSVLEREISTSQALWLLNAQCSLVALIASIDASLPHLLLAMAWGVQALFKCKSIF